MRPSLLTGRNKSVMPQLPESYGVSKLELLSSMDIFRDLTEEEIKTLMDKSPMRTALKDTTFYGLDGPEVLFLLKSGKVDLSRQSPDGRKLTLATVAEGTFFGEMSLLGLHLNGTYAMAREDCVICVLSRHDLESLMLEHPTVALRVAEALTRRLEETRDLLQEIAFNDLTGKVAGLLLQMADGETNIIDGYSHEDLAARVGCLRESFTAVLDRFKRGGAVTTGRKRIKVTDRAQLEGIVIQRTGGPTQAQSGEKLQDFPSAFA